jgi:hypothetical protein
MTCDSVDVLPEMWYNLLNSAQTAQEKRKGYSMKIVLVGGAKSAQRWRGSSVKRVTM